MSATNQPAHSEALRTIGALFESGDVIEIRALNVGQGSQRTGKTHAGYFDFENEEAIAKAVKTVTFPKTRKARTTVSYPIVLR